MYEYFLSNYTDQNECELFPRGFANAFRYIRDNSPVYLKIGENFPIYNIYDCISEPPKYKRKFTSNSICLDSNHVEVDHNFYTTCLNDL